MTFWGRKLKGKKAKYNRNDNRLIIGPESWVQVLAGDCGQVTSPLLLLENEVSKSCTPSTEPCGRSKRPVRLKSECGGGID